MVMSNCEWQGLTHGDLASGLPPSGPPVSHQDGNQDKEGSGGVQQEIMALSWALGNRTPPWALGELHMLGCGSRVLMGPENTRFIWSPLGSELWKNKATS